MFDVDKFVDDDCKPWSNDGQMMVKWWSNDDKSQPIIYDVLIRPMKTIFIRCIVSGCS